MLPFGYYQSPLHAWSKYVAHANNVSRTWIRAVEVIGNPHFNQRWTRITVQNYRSWTRKQCKRLAEKRNQELEETKKLYSLI